MAADDEPDIPTATGAAIPSVAFVNVVHVSAHHPGELERVLHQAFDAQVNGVSTRVVLAPGVYCVSLTFNWARENAAVVAIEAEVSGTAIFSGADRFSGWRRMGELWCADWPYDCAAAPAPPDFNNPFLTTPELMLRREVLVMDGKVLRQQLAASELAPGSFYVDAAARTITLSPPGGKDPAHAVCEVATRSIALHLAGRKNVILRGWCSVMTRRVTQRHSVRRCKFRAATMSWLRTANFQRTTIMVSTWVARKITISPSGIRASTATAALA